MKLALKETSDTRYEVCLDRAAPLAVAVKTGGMWVVLPTPAGVDVFPEGHFGDLRGVKRFVEHCLKGFDPKLAHA
jgi:hypothetical protein